MKKDAYCPICDTIMNQIPVVIGDKEYAYIYKCPKCGTVYDNWDKWDRWE